MRTEDIQVMVDVGILNPRADELTAFLVWGFVLADPIVWQKKLALLRTDPYKAMIPEGGARKVIAAMTAAEKEELRERILAKCESLKPVQAQ